MSGYESAEVVRDDEGRQYHIGLAPGEVAPNILLVGDPARAQLCADQFDAVRLSRHNREFVSFTGTHRGIDITVMGTGIGPDNMEIAVVELCQCVEQPTFIRAGTCGGLQPELDLGDLVISHGAYRLENTSLHFVGEGFPAVAHPEVVMGLLQSAEALQAPSHAGITATAPGFYGAQGRDVPGFPTRDPNILDGLVRQGVKNLEMEVSCLLSLAALRGVRAGAVCTVFASRPRNVFIEPEAKRPAELRCVQVALQAFHALAAMDAARGERAHWHPGLAPPAPEGT